MTSIYRNMISDFLPTVQENEFLPPISGWTTFGGLFILCVLGLAIPVASVSKYKVTVKANAIIRPAGELKVVQAATEGQVMQIFVQENQVVKKGEKIATIDDSRLQTKKSQILINIQQAKLQLVQINAQISAINSQINAQRQRINSAIASAKAEFNGRSREYHDKQITTVSEYEEADTNIKIAEEELHVAQAQLKSTQSNERATEAALGSANSKQKRYENAAKIGALSQDQLEEVQLSVMQQEQAVAAQKATVEAQLKTINRLQQAVLATIGKRQRAMVALNPMNVDVAIASSRIAQEKASGEANIATLNKERFALIQQRIQIEEQLEREQSELKQVESELNQTSITATADGIVFKLNLRNTGQNLRTGEEVVQIVPTNAPLVAKAAVGSEDKSKLKIGQTVLLRIRACPYPDYGTLKGKVKTISPDAITPQKNDSASISPNNSSSNLANFYEVTIAPDSLMLGTKKQQCSIQLGMDGTADIISREETVLQFFLRKARLTAEI
ncbi:HlyD family secretion protein [Plectonema radiosum NIES-515]|uniref:HlyD family secretion protein n=1 Tax=Plectonema radiosum NIES-515 TaxID=2986073 RepID=A0ABT3B9A9_9CYAN|nr:HlyD family secretion protein [Plectonema radiosum]MCV3217509.1 HlyD family secretion protein [Plectonema radiosum NIES-515]